MAKQMIGKITSETGVSWEIFQHENGITLRTKNGFGKYVQMTALKTLIIRYLTDKAKDCTAWLIEAIYHDCNILSVKVLFHKGNEWVV